MRVRASSTEPREHTGGAPIGRAAFIGTVATGLSSLLWGKAAWSRVSGVVSPIAEGVLPVLPSSGWRIYTVADTMPKFDPATWRLHIGSWRAAAGP